MFAVILSFSAVPWLIVRTIKVWRAYQDLQNTIALMGDVTIAPPPRRPTSPKRCP